MIRKKPAPHLDRGVETGFPSRQTPKTFARRSCSNKFLKRDDDSTKSHRALGNSGAAEKIRIHRALAFDVDRSSRLEMPFVARRALKGLGHMDSSRQAVSFHPAGEVHIVTPEVIGELVLADHPRDDRACVDADPQLKVRMPCG